MNRVMVPATVIREFMRKVDVFSDIGHIKTLKQDLLPRM